MMDETRPDGLVGALMAFEGVKGSITALNGPTGCKYYPASLSEAMTRRGGFNPMMHDSRFYLGQSRIPCTYMDLNDYVAGGRARMEELWQDCQTRSPSLLALINSPGASLIGEVLEFEGGVPPTAMMESPPPSVTFSEGYESAILAVLGALRPLDASPEPMTVNLLGMSIADLGWEDSLADLRSLLEVCGIRVLAAPGAGCSVAELKDSGRAALNVMVHDERCQRTAEWYRINHGIPCHRPSGGAPLGFGPLTEWLEGICSLLGADPGPGLVSIKEARRRAAREISRLDRYQGLPRGTSFSVSGSPSLVLPIVKTLHGYLGMVPVAVATSEDGPCTEQLESYLEDIGCGEASTDVLDCPADVVIADGNTAAMVLARGLADNAVDIEAPSMVQVNIRSDPLLGIGGTQRLLDRCLQGLRR